MPLSNMRSNAAGWSEVPPGPPLWLLAELTYRCPLHCAFCSNPVDYARHTAELRNVLEITSRYAAFRERML